MTASISDYALIGDGRTAALVDKGGSISWLCWPRFDSGACLAAILGGDRFGHWTIQPASKFDSRRRYLDQSLILETTFETASGSATLLDFMCTSSGRQCLVRILVGKSGSVAFQNIFSPSADNGRSTPSLLRTGESIVVNSQSLSLKLRSSRSLSDDGCFVIEENDEVAFILSDAPEQWQDVRSTADLRLQAEKQFWNDWCSRCTYDGPWRDVVLRSLITLKALIFAPTGGMIAAPTSSLPETIGGARNWDYRYCWLRDSTFAVMALLHSGYRNEAAAWVEWLHSAVTSDKSRTQPVYGVGGERELTESEAHWLPGFLGSRPVRFGNRAYRQFQLDVYGEVQDTLHQWRRIGKTRVEEAWPFQCAMLERMASLCTVPDDGIWEQRDHPEDFTQSRSMAWVAVDRMIKSAEQFGFEGPMSSWSELRTRLHHEVCTKGFDHELNAFTRSYGSHSLDASTLLLPMVGFLPPDDPRIVGTVQAVAERLGNDGYIYRYDQSRENDGIRQDEGAFLPCSFWYADNLILQNRYDDAAAVMERVLKSANDVGMMSEEYDPVAKTQLGNTPQALTHLSVVHTALNLEGHGPAHIRGST